MTRDALKKIFSDYILLQAETALSIAIIGSIFAKDMRVPFCFFFLPALLGIIYMLPCIILYIKEDLKIWQIMLQRVLEWIFIECGTLWAAHLIFADTVGNAFYIAIFVSVVGLQTLTYVISDGLDRNETDKLNEKLMEMRKRDE